MDDEQRNASEIIEMNDSTSVLHKIANLYAEQLMSDICLVVGENRYPAHRVILCASSEVFQVMLMNPEWNECRESVIELKEEPCCVEVFPQFLRYLYVGQIRISLTAVMPMLALADKYNIKDLVQLCVDYMLKHISKAAVQGVLISWLHYTISFSPYHQEITDAIQQFLKWNLDIIAEARDFVDLDINILIALLQQNDLVLKNEYELFTYADHWFNMKKRQLDLEQTTSSITDEQKTQNLRDMLRSIFIHIRYPMMSPRELAKLMLKPTIKQDTNFFVERIGIGMTYHAGQTECIERVQRSADGALQFTPRLYTSDTYCINIDVPGFDNVDNYQKFAVCFFSLRSLAEQENPDQDDVDQLPWDIDFYPRGIRYGKAQIINVYNLPGSLEIPEVLLRTVRLSVTCKSNLEIDQKFMIGILITGVQNDIKHVRTVHVCTTYFSKSNPTLNIDNILPFGELELSAIKLSPHLIGKERNLLNLQVIIVPMSQHTCYETIPFEFK